MTNTPTLTTTVGHAAPSGVAWEDVRAVMLRIGDHTPSGTVEAIRYYGDLRRMDITISGTLGVFTRGYDDTVSRVVTPRMCATGCGLTAAAGDRYCTACGSATDREGWTA